MINYFSKTSVIIRLYHNEVCHRSTVTGFIYQFNNKKFLITNWHVVTGVNSETGRNIDSQGFKPNLLIIENSIIEHYRIELYSNNYALWYEHPRFKDQVNNFNIQKADVVAIPLEDNKIFNPINQNEFIRNDIKMEIGTSVFVLGYPKGINVNGTPIWKNATIATEPYIDVDSIPKIYIDTATREGMSGAPVIVKLWTESNSLVNNGKLAARFVGIYSGRIPKVGTIALSEEDVFLSQLGVVYKEKLIDEIINSKFNGQGQF